MYNFQLFCYSWKCSSNEYYDIYTYSIIVKHRVRYMDHTTKYKPRCLLIFYQPFVIHIKSAMPSRFNRFIIWWFIVQFFRFVRISRWKYLKKTHESQYGNVGSVEMNSLIGSAGFWRKGIKSIINHPPLHYSH